MQIEKQLIIEWMDEVPAYASCKVRYKRRKNDLKNYLKITKSLLLFDKKCSLGTNDAKITL